MYPESTKEIDSENPFIWLQDVQLQKKWVEDACLSFYILHRICLSGVLLWLENLYSLSSCCLQNRHTSQSLMGGRKITLELKEDRLYDIILSFAARFLGKAFYACFLCFFIIFLRISLVQPDLWHFVTEKSPRSLNISSFSSVLILLDFFATFASRLAAALCLCMWWVKSQLRLVLSLKSRTSISLSIKIGQIPISWNIEGERKLWAEWSFWLKRTGVGVGVWERESTWETRLKGGGLMRGESKQTNSSMIFPFPSGKGNMLTHSFQFTGPSLVFMRSISLLIIHSLFMQNSP